MSTHKLLLFLPYFDWSAELHYACGAYLVCCNVLNQKETKKLSVVLHKNYKNKQNVIKLLILQKEQIRTFCSTSDRKVDQVVFCH